MGHLIDLLPEGHARVTCAYLLAGDEPALVDCGPTATLLALEAGLAAYGLGVGDLRRLLVTHIHLDHAGAAGVLVRANPRLEVHVSAIGAPHLADPSRLERSARRLYGEDFDRLFGELAPIPDGNIHVLGGTVGGLEVVPSPGHASHLVTFVAQDGACYPGDALGVRIPPSSYVLPASAPPEIDVEAWERTIDAIAARRPARIFFPHFGVVEGAEGHLEELRRALARWSDRVRGGAGEDEFVAAAEAELAAAADAATAEAYRRAAPFWQSYAGLKRYWDKPPTSGA